MPQIKTIAEFPFAIMDGPLCYDRYKTREEARVEFKKEQHKLIDAVNEAQLDLENFNDSMKIEGPE